MGIIIPSVPYKSQLDPDASEFRNDCGPTCIAMVLAAYGINKSTNAVFRKTGATADGYVHLSQMMRASESYGVAYRYFSGWNIDRLKYTINQGFPMIATVHYGAWARIKPGVSTQYRFYGPHFVVVVGYDDNNIYVNDPLWSGSRRLEGFRKAWSYKDFNAAWGSNYKDGNRDYSGAVCKLKRPTEAFGGGSSAPPATPDAPPPPPKPVTYTPDPLLVQRIQAWAQMNAIPQPQLVSPAVVNSYLAAMGEWGERVVKHEVTSSDTLGLIALRYYDDPLKWEVITYFNGISLVDGLHDGDALMIPEPLTSPVEIPAEEQPEGVTAPQEELLGLDETLKRRIYTWAVYNKLDKPDLTNPTVARAFKSAVGEWGTQWIEHTVEEGEDQGLLALRFYDDPMKWEVIPVFNGVPAGETVKPGDVIKVPEPTKT